MTVAGGLPRQLVRFAAVGLVSTAVHLGLFATLASAGVASQLANGTALVIATIGNTAANRWWTFGVVGRHRLVTHHGQALLIFAITWVASTAALAVLQAVHPAASTTSQTAVVAAANIASTVLRFVAMRSWIFRGRQEPPAPSEPPALSEPPAPSASAVPPASAAAPRDLSRGRRVRPPRSTTGR